ncbi:MAG: DUF2997 domain-containing protein [Thermoguttaceae bacterium]|jgi:hypothetical protein
MKQIILTIDEEGGVKLETKGYGGQGCKAASKALEEALGVKTADKPTAEMYAAQRNAVLDQ